MIALLGLTAVLVACGDNTATTTSTVVAASQPSSTTAPTTTQAATTTTASIGSTTTTVVVTTSTTEAAAVTTIEIVVSGGAVEGPGRVSAPLGDLIVLTVTADVADEVHFHGYDLTVDVAPGQSAVLEFEAAIPGVFEVELEGARLELVIVEVK
jgi:hypothetical protein